jgi:1A family penicillin-binding protein
MQKIKIVKKRSKKTKIILFVSALILIFLSINILNIFWSVYQMIPLVEKLESRKIPESTKIYDREGKILLYDINAGEKRTVVREEDIPKYLKDATIAVEDEKFYESPGIDFRAIIRALLTNIISGKIVQGGSTITQQVAKNVFLSPEKTLQRKIKEFFLAIEINRRFSKDKILWIYLNEIPYGSNFYGVESASWAYFGKSVKDLNLAESAILAALPKAPTYYSPWGSRVNDLFERQKFILKKMKSLRMIDEAELETALNYKINFQPPKNIIAPHFVMAVQDYLIKKYGEDAVRSGGLIVKTTLDYDLQQIAERVVKEGAERNSNLYNGKNAALVAEDPKTGQILAMVGSKDFNDKEFGNFNVITQGLRQPGSALKPFVYLTAFQKGYTPKTVIFDVPTEFVPNNILCPNPPNYNIQNKICFHPQNFDLNFRGPVNLETALAQSINIPAVKVLYLVGLKNALENLNKFGITTLTDPNKYGLSLVLGGGEVKPIEMISAYSTLANDGIKHKQSLILEVKDSSGKILESSENDEGELIVDQNSVRMINNILSNPELRRGLFGASFNLTVFDGYEVALKTGTTNDYRDAWAFGYTPNLAVGVWAGNNDQKPMQKSGSSILAAIPIWHNFLAEALKKFEPETFPKPEIPQREKPILNGEWLINNEVHSILYYVDKNDPLGPPPIEPRLDPQFNNWEASLNWWFASNKNLINEELNRKDKPEIKIIYPQNGAFVNSNINLQATISSISPIKNINIYLNNKLINSINGNFSSNYNLNQNIVLNDLENQNLLEIEAINQSNNSSKSNIIIYK